MSEEDQKVFEEFKLLKEAGYSALKKLNEEYDKKNEQLKQLNRSIEKAQQELDKLTQAVTSYKKFI